MEREYRPSDAILNNEWDEIYLKPPEEQLRFTVVDDLHSDGYIPTVRMLEEGNDRFNPYIDTLIENGRAEIVEVEFDDGSTQNVIKLIELEDEEPRMDR